MLAADQNRAFDTHLVSFAPDAVAPAAHADHDPANQPGAEPTRESRESDDDEDQDDDFDDDAQALGLQRTPFARPPEPPALRAQRAPDPLSSNHRHLEPRPPRRR